MATFEWGDTFDSYQQASMYWNDPSNTMFKKWTSAPNSGFTVNHNYARPGSSGNGVVWSAGSADGACKLLPAGDQQTRCVGFWVKTSQYFSTTICRFDSEYNSEQVSLRTDASNHLIVSRNGTTLFTSTNILNTHTWYWMEFKATINASTGVFEARVNGSSTGWIPQQTGQNTRPTVTSYASWLYLGATNALFYFDDVVVADDFMGPLVGSYLEPVGPGTYSQWTPNAGTNDAVVREATPDSDVTINYDATSGHIDTFEMSKLPTPSGNILGIQHVIVARQDAGITRTIRPKQRTGSTDYNGTSRTLPASYVMITEAVPVDPSTSSAWTKSGLESAEFGYENV